MTSVTKALSPYCDFSQIPPDVLEFAAERGSRFHAWAESYLLGRWAPVSEDIKGFVESFKRWYGIAAVETLFVEKEIICPVYGFIGHIDWIGRLRGDKSGIISVADWKTPVTESKTWPVQVSAYHYLVKTYLGLDVTRCLAVMPRRDGKFAKVVEYSDFQDYYFNVFLSCLNAHKYFNGG